MYVPTPVQPPESPRVRELSQRIQQLIADFQRQYPMTPSEIRQALFHAAGIQGGTRRRLAVVVVGALATAVAVGVFAARRSGAGGEAGLPLALMVGVAAGVAALLVAIRRSR